MISQLDSALKVAKSICFDSRHLQPKCVFVAIRGAHSDGHQFLNLAVQAGAAALVVEDAAQVPLGFTGVVSVVENSREALNVLAARFYREPSRSLFTVGVTGTNGKTTVTNMIEAIFNEAGRLCGVIGTINHHLGHHVWETNLTTPDPIAFQCRLREFVDLGARSVALEVSSHALSQSRVDEVHFDVGIFTNLSRDHLDYHKDMEDYFQAKNRLFDSLMVRSQKSQRVAIVNAADEYGARILAAPGVTLWKFGEASVAKDDWQLQFEVLTTSLSGTRFRLKTPTLAHDFHILMPGRHNVENAVAAIGAALVSGIGPEICAQALEKLGGVPGRLERVENKKGVNVFVDFAHTSAALESVLKNLGRLIEEAGVKSKIITVFGCGGDRDQGKRPLMLKAAFEGSSQVILTSDNPRTENPQSIVDEALSGLSVEQQKMKVQVKLDRREAIYTALRMAQPGDVVLIAGKGHESYQQVGSDKIPFSDVQVVREFES